MKYVLWFMGFCGVVVLVFVFLMLLLYVVIISPSCTDRGGVDVPNGVVFTNIMVGKVMMPQITQSYKCVIP